MAATRIKSDLAAPRPSFVNRQLAAAMSHPTRVHAMEVLRNRVASPRQLADAIGEPLNNVTYHVKQLRKLGCIELERTERRRGGRVLERFYRASRGITYFDNEAWQKLTEKERAGMVGATVQLMSEDLAVSMSSGIFFERDDNHLSRWPMRVDAEGWEEIGAVLERTAEDLAEVEARVSGRGADGEPSPINAKVELLLFRSPDDDG